MILRTRRLTGRLPTADDLGLYDRLLNDPEVARTMGGHRDNEMLQTFLDRHLAGVARNGFAANLLFDISTGAFVGRGGLNRVSVLGVDEVEVGYALLPEFWGRGLATEVARASIGYAFDTLGCASVVGFTLVRNLASRHVLEKCGMVFEAEFAHYDMPHVLLRVRPSSFTADEPVG